MVASRPASSLRPPLSGDWTDELVQPGPPEATYDETSDSAHVMWIRDVGRTQVRIAWDGVESEPFELISQQSGNPFVWSPDLRRAAWYGRRGGSIFVAIDGIEREHADVSRSVPPTFSADGRHVAYGAAIDGNFRLIVDGEPIADWLPAAIAPVWSPDGERLAFGAENRRLAPGASMAGYRQLLVVDGEPQADAEGISSDEKNIVFSPDSRRLAYTIIEGGRSDLVVDGTVADSAPAIAQTTFSPDSRRLVYATTDPESMTMTGDGIAVRRTYWRVGEPVFSPDSARLAYFAAKRKGLGAIVVDDVEGPEAADFWGNATFSPDSRHVAYLAMRQEGGFLRRKTLVTLVRDGVAGDPWDEVSSPPKFSPDSQHVAFSGRRDEHWFAVVDGTGGAAYPQVGPPRWSTTGRLAYIVELPGGRGPTSYQAMLADRATAPVAEWATFEAGDVFALSADGEHIAAGGRIDDAWRPIVDGKVGPGGTGVGTPRFSEGRVTFLIAASDGAHRVSTGLA